MQERERECAKAQRCGAAWYAGQGGRQALQCPCGDMWQWPDMHLERSGRTEVVSELVPGVRQRDGESQR